MVSESKQASVGFSYERQAMNGNEMPDGLDYPDQIAFLCFRMLYDNLRKGIIGRDTAIREKKKILMEYEQYKFVDRMGKEWVQIIKNTEIARSEYRKCRTLDNADKLLVAVEGVNYANKLP